MLKRIITNPLFLLGLGAMSMNAHALKLATGGSLNLGSLICSVDILGIPKNTCLDGTSSCTVKCDLLDVDITTECLNPGGNPAGESHNSFSGTFLSGGNFVNDTALEGFGREPGEVIISDDKILSALEARGTCEPPETPNEDWSISTVMNFCPGDGINPETGEPTTPKLRVVSLVNSALMNFTFTSTADGTTTSKTWKCVLDPSITLDQAPLCPSDYPASPYKCTLQK